jgi:hypothetical protein
MLTAAVVLFLSVGPLAAAGAIIAVLDGVVWFSSSARKRVWSAAQVSRAVPLGEVVSHRQRKGELRPPVNLAFHLDPSAVSLDQLLDDGQPQSCTADSP